jgi:hypothetical protein
MTTRWLVRTASEQLPEHVRDLAAQAVGLTRDTDVIPGAKRVRFAGHVAPLYRFQYQKKGFPLLNTWKKVFNTPKLSLTIL